MQKDVFKILVVDDEPDIVESLKHFLSFRGFDVVGAYRGEDALNILDEENADAVLLDFMMPGLNGAETARIIKQKHPSVKIIMVTGRPKESENLFKENITDAIFIKPLIIQDLYKKLLDIFSQKKESLPLELAAKQSLKAKIIIIKAKLLFIEPSPAIYTFLSKRFSRLFNKGQEYKLDIARSEKEAIDKAVSSSPDFFIVNASFFKMCSSNFLRILENNSLSSKKEMIVYCIEDINDSEDEIGRLLKRTETVCLKNGFIEIRRVEI